MSGIISLDPATTVGFSFTSAPDGEDPPDFSDPKWRRNGKGWMFWEHKVLGGKNTSPGQIGATFSVFLQSRIETYKPDLIVYEQPYIPQGLRQVAMNFQTLFILLGLAFEIDTISYRYGVECWSVTSPTFINYFTGQGKFLGKDYAERRKNKKAATIQVCKLQGWDATSDEADSLALLAYAQSILYPPGPRLNPTGPLFQSQEQTA